MTCVSTSFPHICSPLAIHYMQMDDSAHLIFRLSDALVAIVVLPLVSLKDFVRMDTALNNRTSRDHFLRWCANTVRSIYLNGCTWNARTFEWIQARKLRVSTLKLSDDKSYGGQKYECSVHVNVAELRIFYCNVSAAMLPLFQCIRGLRGITAFSFDRERNYVDALYPLLANNPNKPHCNLSRELLHSDRRDSAGNRRSMPTITAANFPQLKGHLHGYWTRSPVGSMQLVDKAGSSRLVCHPLLPSASRCKHCTLGDSTYVQLSLYGKFCVQCAICRA